MKVLHFYKTYLPDSIGGIEQVINQIARGTKDLGITTEVLSLSRNVSEKKAAVDGHEVYRCRSIIEIASTPFSVSAFHIFRQLATKADLIHYHFPYPFADVLHMTMRLNKPTLITYHSDIIKQNYLLKLYRPLQNLFLSSVDHIVATSPNYLASSNVLSSFDNKCSVIPIGLDKATYPVASAERINFWRKRFGTSFFLFVGVIRYYKGLHILVDAARNSDHIIVIVGAGPIEAELKQHASKFGIRNIHFLGFLPDDDKVVLLELCYAVVFPSHLRSEAFGISLLEGAMYGKPLVSSEIGTGTTYINIHKETGVVVHPSDPTALLQAMDYLWNNPEEAKQMGKRAEARYYRLFTAHQMATSYTSLYKSLIDSAEKKG